MLISELSPGSRQPHPFLRGGGEAGELIRALATPDGPLGAPETWPHSLRTTLGILLHSAVPMFLIWGENLLSFYNDAYRPSLGNDGRHPCIGRPANEIWPEAWPMVGQQIREVMETGETIFREHQLVPVYRNGKMENVYWTYSYSPVLDEAAKPAGVFISCMETTAAVLAASELVESEQRYRALVNTTADVIYRMNPDWTEMRELDGKGFLSSTNEPMQGWIEAYLDPKDQERVRTAIAQAIRTKRPFKLEHQVLQADGTLGWTYSRAVPILNEAGEITEWFGAATDITEQRKTEEELRAARDEVERRKRLYETITDNTPDLVYVFDLNYRFTYANKALLDMWGRSWDESIGQGLRALGYEEWHATMHEREIDQIVETRKRVRGTVTFPHAELGRRYYDYILTPVIGDSGEVEAVAGTTRDVTDFKYVEAALRESEERFRLMADAIPEIIWVADAEGRNEFMNRRWEEYCGVKFEPLTYSAIAASFIHPDDAPVVTAAFAHALQTGEPLEVEQRNRSASGEYRWFLNRASPYRDPVSGAVLKWFGIGTDIHERKMLQEGLESLVAERTMELEYSNKELHRSNEDLQQFAHVASHDLKEPVRKILTFTNMLEGADGAQLSGVGKLSLDKVRSAAERMMNMVNGVLAYSQLAAADQPLQRIALDETIVNVEADLEVLIQQKGAHLRRAALPAILGAPVLIHQLFYNLLNNALKFSRDGVAPDVSITAGAVRNSMVEICVEDNGIGFEPEYAERIFKTFTRLHSKDQFEGTGLGLSLCRRIVERHGGRIHAESAPGAGTRFTLTLPLAPDQD